MASNRGRRLVGVEMGRAARYVNVWARVAGRIVGVYVGIGCYHRVADRPFRPWVHGYCERAR